MNTSETYAFSAFLLISSLGVVGTILYALSPTKSFVRFRQSFGVDFDKLQTNAEEAGSLRNFFQYFGSLLLGANYFAFFSAWLAFHDHSQLAWWSLTYFPIMFLWHSVITKKVLSEKILQFAFLLLSLSALILTKEIGFPVQ